MKTTLVVATVAVTTAVILSACAGPQQQTNAPVYPSNQQAYAAYYGYIDSIQVIAANNAGGPGAGAVVGGVVGGILGNQVGGGVGKSVATVAGVVGGALVGNQIEQQNRAQTRDMFQISVRLNNGSYQSVQQDSVVGLQVGDRVRIENGRVYRD